MKLDREPNMCKCGDYQMFGSWMCKTCHAQYMKTGVEPSDQLQAVAGVSALAQFEKKHLEKKMGELFGEPETETTAKPSRYNRGSLEVWDAISQLKFDYMQGNIVKYVSRYKDKNGPEDLVKAINYIVKMISQETGIDYYELHKLTPEQLGQRIKK